MHAQTLLTLLLTLLSITVSLAAPSPNRCTICTTLTSSQSNLDAASTIAKSEWTHYPGAAESIMDNTLDVWCADPNNTALKSQAERQVCRDIVAVDMGTGKLVMSKALLAGLSGKAVCVKGGNC